MLQTILSVLLTTTFGLPLVVALILFILAMIIAAPVVKFILRVVAVIAIIATIPYVYFRTDHCYLYRYCRLYLADSNLSNHQCYFLINFFI